MVSSTKSSVLAQLPLIFSCNQLALWMVQSVHWQKWCPCTRSRSQRSKPNLTILGLKLQFEFTYGDKMIHMVWCGTAKVLYCFSRSSIKIGNFFAPCELEIWWMTLKTYRAPLLCYFKLCVLFHSHRSIQTGVTDWKRPIRVKINDFSSCATLKFDRWL